MQRPADPKQRLRNRLKRIEGQVGGVLRMVEQDADCVDILLQLAAVRGALGKVGEELLARHVKTCVRDACLSAGADEQQQKLDELVEVFARFR